MNTLIKIKKFRASAGERLAVVASKGEIVFHSADLANLWGIRNKNTLNKTLFRYAANKLIYRIYGGLYSIKKTDEIDPLFLGMKALHSTAYVSCETVLYNAGVLNQSPKEITLISSQSKRFSIGRSKYRSRKMRNEFLFNDIGVDIKDGVRIASLSRAVADMLYFSPRKYLDAQESNIINWKEVKNIADVIGYKIKIPKHHDDTSR